MDKKYPEIIAKMLEEIAFIETTSLGLTIDEFKLNSEKQHAIIMALLNIGELANSFDYDFYAKYSSIPWKYIVGFRNAAAHGYFALNLDSVWRTLIDDVPKLKSGLLSIS